MEKIIISEKLSTYIETLQYEVNARRDLCRFLIENNLVESEGFKTYHKEYIEYYTEYELAKNQVEKEYIKPVYPNVTNWVLDFSSHEVTVNE